MHQQCQHSRQGQCPCHGCVSGHPAQERGKRGGKNAVMAARWRERRWRPGRDDLAGRPGDTGVPSFRRARDLKNIINSGALEILQDALTCLEMLATCLLVWSSIQKDKFAGISKGTASRQTKDGCRDPRKNCLARQPSKGVSGENTGRLTWENHFILISEP